MSAATSVPTPTRGQLRAPAVLSPAPVPALAPTVAAAPGRALRQAASVLHGMYRDPKAYNDALASYFGTFYGLCGGVALITTGGLATRPPRPGVRRRYSPPHANAGDQTRRRADLPRGGP